jgi:hypothetical protein
MVQDIYPGSMGSDPAYLTALDNKLYFAAADGVHGRELWDPPAVGVPPAAPPADASRGSQQINPVGLKSEMAPQTDPKPNGRGQAFAPNGPFWGTDTDPRVAVSDLQGSRLEPVAAVPTAPNRSFGLTGTPTGVVSNPSSDFVISAKGKSTLAVFLLAGEDDTDSGWNPAVDSSL